MKIIDDAIKFINEEILNNRFPPQTVKERRKYLLSIIDKEDKKELLYKLFEMTDYEIMKGTHEN